MTCLYLTTTQRRVLSWLSKRGGAGRVSVGARVERGVRCDDLALVASKTLDTIVKRGFVRPVQGCRHTYALTELGRGLI